MNEITIFIIDDDQSSRRGIARLVHAAGMHVRSFASAQEFLALGKRDGPGCIVLDVRMPSMTGPELQEELSKDDYCMPIIFLSAHGDVATAAHAMKRGAVDFLTKPVDREELLNAIRVSLAKDAQNRARLQEDISIRNRIEKLTPREYEVMTYILTGLLNKQIAAAFSISEETVKIHRGRIMQKLEVGSVAELVRLCEKASIAPPDTRKL
jgi:FixJ family two-component response regulator